MCCKSCCGVLWTCQPSCPRPRGGQGRGLMGKERLRWWAGQVGGSAQTRFAIQCHFRIWIALSYIMYNTLSDGYAVVTQIHGDASSVGGRLTILPCTHNGMDSMNSTWVVSSPLMLSTRQDIAPDRHAARSRYMHVRHAKQHAPCARAQTWHLMATVCSVE